MTFITLSKERSIAIDNIALFVRFKGDATSTIFLKGTESDVIGLEVNETVEDIAKALSSKQVMTAQFNAAAGENFDQIGLAIDNIASFEERLNANTTTIFPKKALYRIDGFDVDETVKGVKLKIQHPKNTIA